MLQNKKIVYTKGATRQEAEAFAKALKTNTLVAGILLKRGIRDIKAAEEFLYGKAEPFGNPFLIKNMARAVQRIKAAMSKGEHITIYGDYDVDGITASSLLSLFFKERGALVDVYIPKRASEGYGLNSDALASIAASGTTLLLTVDSGISGLAEVAQGPQGMDIIITDHHMPPENLPPAYTIINPHQEGETYPFTDLAGAGVAFKLCQALSNELQEEEEQWLKYVEFAALGTVADLVPLQGENREIVRLGLQRLAHSSNEGLKALIKVSGVADKPLTSETIGFVLAPRMNAAGRLDDAMDVVKLLTCQDKEVAEILAAKLNEENLERQNISKKIYEEALLLLAKEPQHDAIVLANAAWHSGVIGIVASRLVEKFNCPVVLLALDGDKAKGSCRSIPPVNIYEALGHCAQHLEQFGGHSQAAGLSLLAANLPNFRTALQKVCREVLQGKPYVPVIEPDYVVGAEELVDVQAVEKLTLLEPYGKDNPSPVLAFEAAEVVNSFAMGKDNAHLRLSLKHGREEYKALSWHDGELAPSFYGKERAAFAFAPKLNTFKGRTSVDLFLVAVKPERKIVDYRKSLLPKEELVKKILQTEEKTVLYVDRVVDNHSQNSGSTMLTTEEELPPDAQAVILADGAAAKLLTKEPFFLAARPEVTLYLLYRQEDFLSARDDLKKLYPDEAAMRACYKLLRIALQEGKNGLDILTTLQTEDGITLREEILRVFSELNFIKLEGGKVELEQASFNPLANAPTYQCMQDSYQEKIKNIEKLLTITSAEIAAQWK